MDGERERARLSVLEILKKIYLPTYGYMWYKTFEYNINNYMSMFFKFLIKCLNFQKKITAALT